MLVLLESQKPNCLAAMKSCNDSGFDLKYQELKDAPGKVRLVGYHYLCGIVLIGGMTAVKPPSLLGEYSIVKLRGSYFTLS